jgi:hypothetical protein
VEIQAVRSALNQCPTFGDKQDDGTTVTYTITALSFPKVGDQTFSAKLTGAGGSVALDIDLVLARVGRCGLTFADVGIGGVDATVLLAATKTAVSRARPVCS